MPFQILLNLILAFTWMFLNDRWDGFTLFSGYIIGLGLLLLLRRFLAPPFYLKKVVAILNLLILFLKELVLSSIMVVKEVLRPRLDIQPGIFAYPTKLKTDWEITTLSCLITLTPGTLTLDVSPDGDILYIHSMDIRDTEEAIEQIKNTFERAIMEVSR
jgi:multicomponent Na+:H+ antiporter subunit E